MGQYHVQHWGCPVYPLPDVLPVVVETLFVVEHRLQEDEPPVQVGRVENVLDKEYDLVSGDVSNKAWLESVLNKEYGIHLSKKVVRNHLDSQEDHGHIQSQPHLLVLVVHVEVFDGLEHGQVHLLLETGIHVDRVHVPKDHPVGEVHKHSHQSGHLVRPYQGEQLLDFLGLENGWVIGVLLLDLGQLLVALFGVLGDWEDNPGELAAEDIESVLDIGTCQVDGSLELFEGCSGYFDFGEGEREYLGLEDELLSRFLRVVLALVAKEGVVPAGEGLVEGEDVLALHLLDIKVESDLFHLGAHFFQLAFHHCSLPLLYLYLLPLEHVGPELLQPYTLDYLLGTPRLLGYLRLLLLLVPMEYSYGVCVQPSRQSRLLDGTLREGVPLDDVLDVLGSRLDLDVLQIFGGILEFQHAEEPGISQVYLLTYQIVTSPVFLSLIWNTWSVEGSWDPLFLSPRLVLFMCITEQIQQSMNNRLKKSRLAKNQIVLPHIQPCFKTAVVSLNLESAMTTSIKNTGPSLQYLELIRKFERDFNSNKLAEQFDRVVDSEIKRFSLESVSMDESDLIRSISKQVRHKMFQNFVQQNKKKPRSIQRSSIELSNRQWTMPLFTNAKQSSMRSYSKQQANRVFDLKNSMQSPESPYKSKVRDLYRKFNNKKIYYQMMSPSRYSCPQPRT